MRGFMKKQILFLMVFLLFKILRLVFKVKLHWAVQ